jgi:hypothetical protein
MLFLDWVVAAIYILAAGSAGWWMDNAAPPKDVMRSYPFLTTMKTMIPFVAVRKWSISDQHAVDFEGYRRRMWIATAILIGFGWLTSIYFWFRLA